MVKADLTRDYYGDLGLTADADIPEIKKQFKKLALTYHPDRNPGRETEVTAKFQKIQSAHEVLTDPTERAKYDSNRRSYGGFSGASGTRGSPWSNVSSQFPVPPKAPTARRKADPPPASAGAERYRKNFASAGPPPSAYAYQQEGPGARAKQYEAFENMKHGKKSQGPPPPPRNTAQSARAENNVRAEESARKSTNMPPPPKKGYREDAFNDGFTSPRRSQSSSSHNGRKGGFQPNTPGGGDEPPAPRGNYFNTGKKPTTAPNLPPRDAGSRAATDSAPPIDPLKQFRDQENMPSVSPRVSTPYATHGGEKFNPFESASMGRSKSSREKGGASDSDSTYFPRTGSDSNLKTPNRPKPFAVPRGPKGGRAAMVDDDSSDSDSLPQMNGSGSRPSTNTRTRTRAGQNTQQQAAGPSQSPTSKHASLREFQRWWNENPDKYVPDNGWPAEESSLPTGQATPDTNSNNGNPSMYARPDSFVDAPKSTPLQRSASYPVKLPKVTEMPARDSTESATKPKFNSSNIFANGFGGYELPETRPSGVLADPNLYHFEQYQYSLMDGILKRATSKTGDSRPKSGNAGQRNAGRHANATPRPKVAGTNSLRGREFTEYNLPGANHPAYYPANNSAKGPNPPPDMLDPVDSPMGRNMSGRAAKKRVRLNYANDGYGNYRFSFNLPDDTFTGTTPRTNSFSSSAENISTKFTASNWDGTFSAGNFDPSASGVPLRGSSQSSSRSRGRSPPKNRVPPIDPKFMPRSEDDTTQSPGGTKFSAEEWQETFRPATFQPQFPPTPNVSQRHMQPGRKRSVRPTMGGNAAVVDESGDSSEFEKPLFGGSNTGPSPPTAASPEPMDVDTPPATRPQPVPFHRPEFATSGEKLNINTDPLKRSAPTKTPSPVDTTALKVGLEDLEIKDIMASLPHIPNPPELPTQPEVFAIYMKAWDLFNIQFLQHMVGSKRNADAMGEKRWTDPEVTEKYRVELKQDAAVLARWTEAREQHARVMRDWVVAEEREAARVKASIAGNEKRKKTG